MLVAVKEKEHCRNACAGGQSVGHELPALEAHECESGRDEEGSPESRACKAQGRARLTFDEGERAVGRRGLPSLHDRCRRRGHVCHPFQDT